MLAPIITAAFASIHSALPEIGAGLGAMGLAVVAIMRVFQMDKHWAELILGYKQQSDHLKAIVDEQRRDLDRMKAEMDQLRRDLRDCLEANR